MKVLVVEDDPKIAQFVTKGLKESGYVVDTAFTGSDGLHLALSHDYSAAILDIMLPEVDGLQILEKLRATKKNLPVLILSAKRGIDDRVKGLQMGGDDYLTKPFAFSELLARLQALIRRASQQTHEVTKLNFLDLELDLLTREVKRRNKDIQLQSKEFSLLEYFMRNPKRILSKTAILENVYDYNFDPQTNVVDVLVSRLRKKIDKGFEPKLIHTVRGMGYVLKED